MPALDLLRFPDPRLKATAAAVDPLDPALPALIDDLFAAMRAAPGVGMTACHAGILKRIVVIDLDGTDPQHVLNPEIIWSSEDTHSFTEGSVCMPGALDTITRPARIRLRYQVAGADSWLETDMDGFLSTVMQHEIDQLNGVFFLDRLSRLKRDRLIAKWNKSSL
jgi:peptide deformylase